MKANEIDLVAASVLGHFQKIKDAEES